MRITSRTGKITLGSLAALFWLAGSGVCARAADGIDVTAVVDRSQISQDDSVSLRITVKAEGATKIEEPEFNAPDFEVINEYRGTYVESYYQNGQFGMRNNEQITKILKPLKSGNLVISGVRVRANGKVYTNPTVFNIQVSPSGAGTPPPRGYGGSGIGLRGAGKRVSAPFVSVRAEIDRNKAYKGEQIIVSYYLYKRVRVFNIQVDKFPTLNGFLREDLEMPVLNQRLDAERVTLDGVPYERSLLVRYAAYPLQDGKLQIDPMTIKYNYYSPVGSGQGGEDDEDVFMNFFRQMAPKAGEQRSEPLTIQVEALPEEGKPDSFSGGVGDFTISTAVDKYDVKAGEAVSMTVKIEGKGNAAAIGEPKAHWPENVELYDTKGHSQSGKGGMNQKVFEFLLIPRAPGKLELPPVELSYFDPISKKYMVKKSEPVSINVREGAPGTGQGTMASNPAQSLRPGQAQASTAPELRPLMGATPQGIAEGAGVVFNGQPIWRWLYWICGLALAILVSLIGYDLIRHGRKGLQNKLALRARVQSRSWDRLKTLSHSAANGLPWNEVSSAYELLESQIFDAIDREFHVGARSYPRGELGSILTEKHKLHPETWSKLAKLLEFTELVRFASSAGAISESAARNELAKWVLEGERLARALRSNDKAAPKNAPADLA